MISRENKKLYCELFIKYYLQNNYKERRLDDKLADEFYEKVCFNDSENKEMVLDLVKKEFLGVRYGIKGHIDSHNMHILTKILREYDANILELFICATPLYRVEIFNYLSEKQVLKIANYYKYKKTVRRIIPQFCEFYQRKRSDSFFSVETTEMLLQHYPEYVMSNVRNFKLTYDQMITCVSGLQLQYGVYAYYTNKIVDVLTHYFPKDILKFVDANPYIYTKNGTYYNRRRAMHIFKISDVPKYFLMSKLCKYFDCCLLFRAKN